MQKLLALFVIMNIVCSNAVFLQKPKKAGFNVFTQLKQVEQVSFGKKLLDTIALQLSANSPLGDIARMLAEIRQDLATQQADADSEHTRQEQECADTVAALDRTISDNNNEKAEAENEIAQLTNQLSALNQELNVKTVQQGILNDRASELDANRQLDSEEFTRRQQQAVDVAAALDLINERLGTIAPNTNDDNLALAELAKIGNTNPIAALIQVASTFSQESLSNVINKLTQLKEDLEASAVDDAREEQEAVAEYETLKAEIAQTIEQVTNQLSELRTQIAQSEAALELQQRRLQEAVANIFRAQEEKAAKLQQCEEWRNAYAEDTTGRQAEIAVVKQVEQVIATKLDTMKDYLKDRANN